MPKITMCGHFRGLQRVSGSLRPKPFATICRRLAEYSFRHDFSKHSTQWVPLSLVCMCKRELTELLSAELTEYTAPSNSETKTVLPPLIFWAPVLFLRCGVFWFLVAWIWAIPSFLPSLEIQYDQIPLTRLGVAETLLGFFCTLYFKYFWRFLCELVYNMGHENGSDVCRHHIFVSDTRRLMSGSHVLRVQFDICISDLNAQTTTEKRHCRRASIWTQGFWGESLLFGGQCEAWKLEHPCQDPGSHLTQQRTTLFWWNFCLSSLLHWFCDLLGHVPRLWTYSGSWKPFSHTGNFVVLLSFLERRLWNFKAFHSHSGNSIAFLRTSASNSGH